MAASISCLKFPKILTHLKNQIKIASASLRQLSYGQPQVQEIVPDYTKIEDQMSKQVFAKVNEQIVNKAHGRLFAIVHILGSQYKVTQDDLVVLSRRWAPTLGDVIRLEKVLLLGSRDFTLIGRPLLPKDQVSVIATVIEKRLSHTKPLYKYKARRNNKYWKFIKNELTYLRINSITIDGEVNALKDTDGLDNRIF